MVNFIMKDRYSYDDLLKLVTFLRSENGCPWDREQTHGSIRRNLLEEAYEACEGIDLDDPALMQEEFGDVLLQVVFHTDIERQSGRFSMDDVIDTVCKKLIFRHPHLFADCDLKDWDWEEMKKQEKGTTSQAQELERVARSLPALIRAEKVQNKAKKVGCGWESFDQACHAAQSALNAFCQSRSQEDLGRALFALVGSALTLQLDGETALQSTADKFVQRFAEEEQQITNQKRAYRSPSELTEG